MRMKKQIIGLHPIYNDSQTELDLLGIARLIEKKKDGLPFILDSKADNKQKVWIVEHWEIEWILKTALGHTINPEKKIFPIRTLFYEGIGTSKEPSYRQEYAKDKFIEIDGIEIY